MIDCSVSVTPAPTANGRTVPPPESVILSAPSSVVARAIVFGVVKTIVNGLAPQLKVMLPPARRAASSMDSVQLPGVPVPTVTA
jgi:hypothetical protein